MTAHVTASVIPLRQQTPMHPSALDERVIMLDIDQIEPYEHNPKTPTESHVARDRGLDCRQWRTDRDPFGHQAALR